ncbi:MAG: PH domain-containing protein [Patescibacteria group bacterium]
MIKMKEGERVIKEVRRHWFIMLGPLFSSFLLAITPLVLTLLLKLFSFDVFQYLSFEGPAFCPLVAFYCLWLLLVFIFLTVQWTEYYLDVWYITNMRIVDIEQIGLFSRKAKTLNLERVQDATVEVRGFIATMLNFGAIHVQTAGVSREILLPQSRDPYEVKRVVFKAIEERKRLKKPEDKLSPENNGPGNNNE